MDRRRRAVTLVFLAALTAIALSIAVLTVTVYRRLSDTLTQYTREALRQRVYHMDRTVASVFAKAAEGANMLMASLSPSGLEGEQGRAAAAMEWLERGITGCRRIWLRDRKGGLVPDRFTPMRYLAQGGWFEQYLPGPPVGERRSFFIREREFAAFVGPPFRDELGTSTILPLVVYHIRLGESVYAAFVEIDLTEVLYQMLFPLRFPTVEGAFPVELSVYDQRTRMLVESSRNLPLVVERPLLPWTYRGESRGVFADSKPQVIEASLADPDLGLVFVGTAPAGPILRTVQRVSALILVVGAGCLAVVIGLGLFAARTLERMQDFRHEQLRARFQALINRMNPHFLFNTLDSMIGVAEAGDIPKLLAMFRALSQMLHASIRRNREVVSVREELSYAESYVALQEVRFPGRFRLRTAVEEEVLDCGLYPFTLQPLVENSIVHAAQESHRPVDIRVSLTREHGDLLIEVEDSGPGCPPEVLKRLEASLERGGVGEERWSSLLGIHNRVRMLHGRRYGLELAACAGGFRVRLRAPALQLGGPGGR